MTTPITPELIETAARAHFENTNLRTTWDEACEADKDWCRNEVRPVLAAVAPLIDRAARADERRNQADAVRSLVLPRLHTMSTAALAGYLSALASDLERRAAALSVPTEEN